MLANWSQDKPHRTAEKPGKIRRGNRVGTARVTHRVSVTKLGETLVPRFLYLRGRSLVVPGVLQANRLDDSKPSPSRK